MFYTNYLRLCASVNKAPTTVAEELGLKRATVTRWKGGARPTDINLQKVADYFNVTVESLLGETPARREVASSPREAISREDVWFALAGEVDVELDEDDFADIASYAQYRIEQKRKKKQESE